jgi:hypothetical protein
VSDFDLIQQISKEIREDPDKPVFDHMFDVTDEVACELALYEADFFVEAYLERYRNRFANTLLFESFVRANQKNFRSELKEFIHLGRVWAREVGFSSDDEGDDDGGV